MVANTRVRFDICFTVNSRHQITPVCQQLGTKLSRLFGGVTFYNNAEGATGYWTADSHLFLAEYPSEAMSEPLVVFSVSVVPDKQASALEYIKSELQQIKNTFLTNSSYVHIESQVVESHHFKLD
jgi:hypothetical protein